MSPLAAVLIATVLAAAVSSMLCAAVAWAGPLDRPRARGAHDRAVVTSGGVAIMAGAGVGLFAFALLSSGKDAYLGKAALALAFAGAAGLLGALDDLFDVGAKAKLLAQAALSLAFAVLVARIEGLPLTEAGGLPLGFVAGVVGTALWLVVVTNAVNFMDGANGLASGSVAVASLAFAAAAMLGGAPALGAGALAGAGAAAGFLPWVSPRARLFQGDAGALFSSFLLASLAVIAAGADGRGAVPVWFAPTALLPFLTDVLLTLLWRARRGRPLFDAHREHLYQLWLQQRGRPHTALAWRMALIMAAYGAVALLGLRLPSLGQLSLFGAMVLVSAAGWIVLRRRLEVSLPLIPAKAGI